MEIAGNCCIYCAGSKPTMITKLLEKLGLLPVQPLEPIAMSLASETKAIATEVQRRRETLEGLGFPFADALPYERGREYTQNAGHADD